MNGTIQKLFVFHVESSIRSYKSTLADNIVKMIIRNDFIDDEKLFKFLVHLVIM